MKLKCKSCGNMYNAAKGCACWAALRAPAAERMAERARAGGCVSCGSLHDVHKVGKANYCRSCLNTNESASKEYGAAILAAGMCPVCCDLPHRRDGVTCSWCGEERQEIHVEADAWASYAAMPPEEMLPSEYSAAAALVDVNCPSCGAPRRMTKKNAHRYPNTVCRKCAKK